MSLLKVAGSTAASGTLYVDDVFSTYLYTGNSSTQTITNGIDLAGKGGLVWIKSRMPTPYNHALIDSARGLVNGNLLATNSTGTAALDANAGISSFNSIGFTLRSDSNGYGTNYAVGGDIYASWTFRKAAKFFDVVTYTGTGSARTIAHSLGVAPGMIIVKRTDTTGNWQVYSNGLTSAAYSIQLNLTNAQASAPAVWNSTAPTSSVFTVGTDATVNASGGSYVAYLFAHDTSSTGIIQCGSFTYSGSPVSVNLGWEPQYILYKNADAGDYWNILDSMRGWSTGAFGSQQQLYADNANAESTASAGISPTATGFLCSGMASNKYIYMAIRRPNKPPTSGTQVFSPLIKNNAQGTQNTTDFTVDLQWAKYRSGVSGTYDADRLRGVSTTSTTGGQHLVTSSTAAEVSTNATQFWNNTGFQTSSGWAGTPMAYYNFKRAPGFFDVVCYTGAGANTTQAHNLAAVPEMMIVKERSAVNDWWVYVSSVGNTKYSVLNSTAIPVTSSTAWNNTTPTASVFSIGTGANVNASTQTFVAYLFATLAGISKVGSYTGNGTGQAIACGFSAGARFVLIKRTDSTGDWYTFDSARGLTSGSSPYLLLNSTAAETTGNNGVYASTGGFTLDSTASTTTNINGASYIYLSVA